MNDVLKEWVAKAESDFATASRVCFEHARGAPIMIVVSGSCYAVATDRANLTCLWRR